ncbi:hypothetical protein F8M41_007938 [Gigaspora margarita]|uniref:F-box domain-containing protein n=1 Tax=Gigaspora margarita TaxID=4874 RepID=A0A8H3X5U4_GIGMA|nr:hypothetical protein F8M41_007938 [Gigaspora margarita]
MIPLPNECFFKIFNNLCDCGNYSLLSCLLVNRQWCRIIVPILWSKPNFTLYGVINTCLLTLNAEEQALLIPFNTILPDYQNQNLLFEYTSYVTSVASYCLFNGIEYWLNCLGYEAHDSHLEAITCSLIAMFIRTKILLLSL